MKKRKLCFYAVFILLILPFNYAFAETTSGEINNLKSTFNYDSSKVEKSLNISVNDSVKFGGSLSKYLNFVFYYKQAVSLSNNQIYYPAFSYTINDDSSSGAGDDTYRFVNVYNSTNASKFYYLLKQYDSLKETLGAEKAYYSVQYAIYSIVGNYSFVKSNFNDNLDIVSAVDALITGANNITDNNVLLPKINVIGGVNDDVEYVLENGNEYVVAKFKVDISNSDEKTTYKINVGSDLFTTDVNGNNKSSNFANNSEFLVKVPVSNLKRNEWNDYNISIEAEIPSVDTILQYDSDGKQSVLILHTIGGFSKTSFDYRVLLSGNGNVMPSDNDGNGQSNTSNDLNNTPQTGNSIIYFVWIFGIAAVGYFIYYFKMENGEDFD